MKVYKGESPKKQDPLPRTLEDLDALDPHDPERDEICKRLNSPEDQTALMARYGYAWPPKRS
jgi:hypothetical protein